MSNHPSLFFFLSFTFQFLLPILLGSAASCLTYNYLFGWLVDWLVDDGLGWQGQ
jgi:hypothetical protein